jgi:hypothetical protein
MLLEAAEAQLALTDPPYHDDVQYGELSLPLRVWAGLSTGRLEREALVNNATGHNSEGDSYETLLTTIFVETRRVLRPDGHLIFSYANREPAAWVAVLTALNNAGFRACGYAVLHSENETDVAKRNVRACALDFLMDIVPAGPHPIVVHEPSALPETDEGDYLRVVARAFLRVGTMTQEELDELQTELALTRFIAATSPAR